MFNIDEMAEAVKDENAWRSTPYPVTTKDYIKIVVWAIRKFFVDINHPDEYDRTLYITSEDNVLYYDQAFNVIQEEYIFILCKMKFLNFILSDLSGDGAVSYTTDALSVTGAKEGYKSIQQELETLEQERIRVFHKMMAHEG